MYKKGVGNLSFITENMTGPIYKSIEEKNLYESARKLKLSKNFVLMHDNEPKHYSTIIIDRFHPIKTKKLPYPPQSPDLNPLKHIWIVMKGEFKKVLRQICKS